MKHISAPAIALAALSLFLSSCLGKDAPIYSGTEACNVISSTRLVSDSGLTLNITGNHETPIPDTLKRVMVDCDVIGSTEGAGDEYDIRINSFTPMTVKNAVKAADFPGELGEDGIDIEAAWLGGGYLNAFAAVTQVKESATVHSVNLEWEQERSGSDTLYFRFRHNAFGESFDNPDVSASSIETKGHYYSFPLDKLIPSGTKSIVIHLESDWFISSDGVLFREKKTYTGNLTYSE